MNLPQNSFFFLWEIFFSCSFSSDYAELSEHSCSTDYARNLDGKSTFGRWHSGDNGCEIWGENEVCYLCYMNLDIIGMELLYKELTDKILGAAYQVHRELGCGFRKRLRVYTIVDFSFIRTFAPSF